MVTFKCHAAGTGCPLAAERDQPRAEQVWVHQRAGKAPRQLLRDPGGLTSQPVQSVERVRTGACYIPRITSAGGGQGETSRDERPETSRQERGG